MSRTVFPVSFAGKKALQLTINKKHVADKTNSVLIGYFKDHDIVFADDLAAGTAAQTIETTRLGEVALSETATNDRDKAYQLPWQRTLQWGQFLKEHYDPNPKELLAWGLPALVGGKIKYPSGFVARSVITNAIITKHLSYTLTPSPLLPFITENEDDLTLLAASVTKANDKEVIRSEMKKSAGMLTNKRDKKWAPPYKNVKGIHGFLKTLYPDDTKMLQLYGFNEVDTPMPTSERTVKILPLKEKKISGIVLGSVLENTGDIPFVYYIGSKKTGTAITVKVGEKVGMNKGASIIIATNPNTIGLVTFKVITY